MGGFRFACMPGCTNCCQQTGYVYLTAEDLRRAAAFLRLAPPEFERKYVYRTTHLLRLRKPRGAQCPFLRASGCAIHPAKPHQCRAFPFWPELIGAPEAWNETSQYCPGIGAGPLLSYDSVLRIANLMRESYPELYKD
jgi:Fe-S-cluster containining protein